MHEMTKRFGFPMKGTWRDVINAKTAFNSKNRGRLHCPYNHHVNVISKALIPMHLTSNTDRFNTLLSKHKNSKNQHAKLHENKSNDESFCLEDIP